MMVFRIVLILLFFFSEAFVLCQSDNLPDIIISTAEYLSADESDSEAAVQYIERLMDLIDNKVRINTGKESEIARIFFLTEFQVKILADYVRNNGGISTVYEIAYIPGFDTSLAMMTEPFLSFEKEGSPVKARFFPKHNLTANLIYRKANDSMIPDLKTVKTLTKYRMVAGDFSGGLTFEKDAGEESVFRTNTLPDFFSGYLSYEGSGVLRKFIAGDYSVRTGQGTNANTGSVMLSSLLVNDFLAGKNEIREYTSTNENNFFRGAAAGIHLNFADILIYYSQNKTDATVNYNTDSVPVSVNNLYTTGLHDTSNSLLKRDVLKETAAGANINFNIKNFRLGLTVSGEKFSLPFNNQSNELRDLRSFSGKSNYLLTTDYKWLYRNFILFGEYTYNSGGGSSIIQGMKLKPDNRLTINFIAKHFSGGFISIHGSQAGGTSEINETSLRANMIFEAAKSLFISAGTESEWHQWLEFNCDQPSYTAKNEIKAGYYPSDKLSMELYYSNKLLMKNYGTDLQLAKAINTGYRDVKAVVRYFSDSLLNICTRIEYKILSDCAGKGMLVAQDFNLVFRQIPLRVWLRYSVFDTDNYDSRIYVWENDLINSFSVPGLSGRGTRSYLMVSWKIKTKAEIRFKYGITTLSEPSGHTTDKEEFRFQLKLLL